MSFITKFETFLFKQLPLYFKVNDSYKDVDGKGLLERFLEVIGKELDDEVIPYLDNYTEIRDVDLTPDRFVPLLARDLGSPPNLLADPLQFRKLLRYIVTYYKIKGIEESYILFFSLLGYNVNIVEYPELDFRMDSGYLMDDGNLMDSTCQTCSDYEIIIMPAGAECNPYSATYLDQDLLDLIILITHFTEPINANLIGIISKVEVCEEIEGCISEDITAIVTQTDLMDSGYLMDDGNLMDTTIVISTFTLSVACGQGSTAVIGTETPDEAIAQEQSNNSPILV